MTAVREIAAAQESAVAAAAPTASPRPFVVKPRRPGFVQLAEEFWRYRLLIPFFGMRALEKRFARTWLGLLWLPLRPGVNLALRILVFGGLVGISTGKTPYPIFFIVATAAWQLFYESAFWSMRSIELNRRVLSRVYVPRLVVISSALVPAVVDFAVNLSFAVLAVVFYFFRTGTVYVEVSMRTLLVPAGLVLMVLLGLGVGLWLADAGSRARDVRFSVVYLFQFLYFLTPVIYPLTAIPNSARPVAELNPMTGAVEMVKDGLFRAHELSPDAVYVTLFWVILMWGPSLWLYDRKQVNRLHYGRRMRLPFRRAQ